MKRHTISIAMLILPAHNAPPMAQKLAEMTMAFLRPSQSPTHPWEIAPSAAPAAKREFTAPMIEAVYELVGSKLKYL
jgi:hypothetical protein